MGTSLIVLTGAVYHYPAPMVKNLVHWWCSHKNVQSNRIYVSVGIVGISHVPARQCTSTPNLQNGCVFGSQDAW